MGNRNGSCSRKEQAHQGLWETQREAHVVESRVSFLPCFHQGGGGVAWPP